MIRPITIALLSTVVVAMAAVALTLHRPLGADVTARPDHQCEQSEDFTCADAALVSAYSWVGKTVTERQMIIACHTDRHGTTAAAVAEAAHSAIQPFPLSAPGRTFVVYLSRSASKNHMVCAHGEAGGWTVNDPALDHPQHWTNADFSEAMCAIEVTK